MMIMSMILAAPMTTAMLIIIYKQRNPFTGRKRRLWEENTYFATDISSFPFPAVL